MGSDIERYGWILSSPAKVSAAMVAVALTGREELPPRPPPLDVYERLVVKLRHDFACASRNLKLPGH